MESLVRKIDDAIYFAGGAEKIIFGSDYPVTAPTAALALVRRLKIEQDDVDRILWRNSEKLFGV